MADLKPVYRAVSKQTTEDALVGLEAKWGGQYTIVIKFWCRKWTIT